MKIYRCPEEVEFGKTDFANYDLAKELARERQHATRLKDWLTANGWNGPATGGIVSFPVGDGRAQYMLGDGKKPCLIHLPYGDSYQYRDAEFLPKAEILKRIKQEQDSRDTFANSQGAKT